MYVYYTQGWTWNIPNEFHCCVYLMSHNHYFMCVSCGRCMWNIQMICVFLLFYISFILPICDYPPQFSWATSLDIKWSVFTLEDAHILVAHGKGNPLVVSIKCKPIETFNLCTCWSLLLYCNVLWMGSYPLYECENRTQTNVSEELHPQWIL